MKTKLGAPQHYSSKSESEAKSQVLTHSHDHMYTFMYSYTVYTLVCTHIHVHTYTPTIFSVLQVCKMQLTIFEQSRCVHVHPMSLFNKHTVHVAVIVFLLVDYTKHTCTVHASYIYTYTVQCDDSKLC